VSSPYRINATALGGRDGDVARFALEVRAARQRGRLLALGLLGVLGLLALAPLAGRPPAVGRVGPEDVGERSGIAWSRSPARLPVGFRLELPPWRPCNGYEACDF